MLNTNTLKQTLAGKVSAIQTMDSLEQTTSLTSSQTSTLQPTISITINIPFNGAQSFLARLATFMGSNDTVPVGVNQTTAAVAKMPSTTENKVVSTTPILPVTEVPAERLSDKQRALICGTIKRKKLSAKQVEAILVDKFGVDDGSNLSKRQASQFIDMLLAQ